MLVQISDMHCRKTQIHLSLMSHQCFKVKVIQLFSSISRTAKYCDFKWKSVTNLTYVYQNTNLRITIYFPFWCLFRYHQLLNIDIDDVDEKSSLPPPFANVKIADGMIWRIWSRILGFLRRLTGNQLHYIMPILVLILSVGLQVSFHDRITTITNIFKHKRPMKLMAAVLFDFRSCSAPSCGTTSSTITTYSSTPTRSPQRSASNWHRI